ncbi:hypothetical protein [Streptomyces reniochalinae]|uniref:Uncharacterized protein n=1 Tax=Streptomyces reniochalinae TaxID=2250578 RepID=A0A367EUL5_9ACTN|nr:hypothetical protein [Streptomyces reniochalinae]RCG21808.1 hypothetical protein DQ392_08860 [Streptomyces reniochalinae]
MSTSSQNTDRFREALESAVEDTLIRLPEEVVTAVWNACDDERGRLSEENDKLREQLTKLNIAANRALDSLNMLITEVADPGVEALGARYQLHQSLASRTPHSVYADPTSPEQARSTTLAKAIEAARGEYLTDDTRTEEDRAYNRAVSDVIAAIDALRTGGVR